MTTTIAPLYQHDCDTCQYLGRMTVHGDDCDLYVHVAEGRYEGRGWREVTAVARYGSGVPEYRAMPVIDECRHIDYVAEVERRMNNNALIQGF